MTQTRMAEKCSLK